MGKNSNNEECDNSSGSRKVVFWILLFVVAVTVIFFINRDFKKLDFEFENNLTSMNAQVISLNKSLNTITSDSKKTIGQLNKELLNTSKQFSKASGVNKSAILSDLLSIATERKGVISKEMKKNPRAVLNNSINPSLLNQIPNEIKSLIEENKKIKGELEYNISDYFEKEFSNEEYFITEPKTNKRYKVYVTEQMPAMTGDTVEVDGLVFGDEIVVDSKKIKKENKVLKNISAKSQLSQVSGGSSPVTKKVLVILFNWQNDQSTPVTVEQARQIYFTGNNSVKNFYLNNTYGQLNLVGKTNVVEGDVYGWFTIPQSNAGCSSNIDSWTNAAKSAAMSSGVSFSGYDLISYAFPVNFSCGWGGKAQFGGQVSWVNSIQMLKHHDIAHEIGHNLGRQHAGVLSCMQNGTQVSLGGNCTTYEYMDPFGVMSGSSSIYNGQSVYSNMSTYHKGLTGNGVLSWISSSAKLLVNRSTSLDSTYTLVNQNSETNSGAKSIQIPKSMSNTAGEYYYVELSKRSNSNLFDSDPSSNDVGSVFIRIAPNYNVSGISKLIDTRPGVDGNGSTNFRDAALTPGSTFRDSENGINIEAISVSPDSAQIRVYFNQPSCNSAPPIIAMTPINPNVAPGQTTTFNVSVRNMDNTSTCQSSNYNVTSVLPAGLIQSPSSFITNQIAPGATDNYSINITSSDSISSGYHTFSLNAQNVSSPSVTGTTSNGIEISSADTEAPNVTITSPSSGSTVPNKGSVTLSANANDPSGIANITILLNGQIMKSCNNIGSCSIKKNVSSFSNGLNNITVTARDGSINANTRTTTIPIVK